jgi:hypothetical protein
VVGGDARAQQFCRNVDERIAAEQHLFPPNKLVPIIPQALISD